jgi:hypothetical protein
MGGSRNLRGWVLAIVLIFGSGFMASATAQSRMAVLRLHIADGQGLSLPSEVMVLSEGDQVKETLSTDGAGNLAIRRLPYGRYLIIAEHRGFAPATRMVELRSAIPQEITMALLPAANGTSVTVEAEQTLLDRDAAGQVYRIGKQQISSRDTSLPGRGLIDLLDSEPGWLFEGNDVLHPRGSEYQTQFVVNGIPLTDNRSPGFGTQIEAEAVQSLAVYTAGIPAEYGRKLGGVVEVNTLHNIQKGWHAEAVLSGGSFNTENGFADANYGWGRNSAGASASGAFTNWYENPPVLQNYTNNGTIGDFAGNYERQLSGRDWFTAEMRHEFAHFLTPNEQVQQAAGQRQHRESEETMGTAAWQHILSASTLTELSGMARDDRVLLNSNAASTPIVAGQDRGFHEGYLKGTFTQDWNQQEFKTGFEGDLKNLREAFDYTITDPTQFDPGTPKAFTFFDRGRDREGALFLEDTLRLGNWTMAPGLRWDDYSLVVHQSVLSPRLSIARYFEGLQMIAHVSYDHVFQTPAFENILLSSSTQVASLDPLVLRKPVEPSTGNYYEVGISKLMGREMHLEVNAYSRRIRNFADDNPLLDTAISFPINFQAASIYGAEGKLDVLRLKRLSGFASYSYMVGTCSLPVTGGLFLGEQATQALDQFSGRLWVSQDQRNTLRTRWMLRLPEGFEAASRLEYDSGLPVDFDGTRQQALAQYGASLVNRVNFSRGRVDPSLTVNASIAREWQLRDRIRARLEADGENLNNQVDLLDFAGLFSGNAVQPPRSGDLVLRLVF